MSSNNPESQGQDWPIYPGSSEPVEERRSSEPFNRSSSSEPVEERFSEPVEERFSEPPTRFSEPPTRFSEPVEERYTQDDAHRAYQSYVHPQPTDHYGHPRPIEGHPSRPSLSRPSSSRPSSSSALQKKYVWIAIGIVAALVITSIARGGFSLWPLIIFGAIAWWIVGNKRKC